MFNFELVLTWCKSRSKKWRFKDFEWCTIVARSTEPVWQVSIHIFESFYHSHDRYSIDWRCVSSAILILKGLVTPTIDVRSIEEYALGVILKPEELDRHSIVAWSIEHMQSWNPKIQFKLDCCWINQSCHKLFYFSTDIPL